MKNSTFRKFASMLLSAFVAFSLIAVTTNEVKALSYEMDPDSVYVGEKVDVVVKDSNGNSYAYSDIKSVKSSKPKVLKATITREYGGRDYVLKGIKAGKAKITIKLKDENGETKEIVKTVKVKPYPGFFKSLKINDKKVDTQKYKYYYTVKNYKKTSAIIKFTLRNGWKKYGDTPALCSKSGDFDKDMTYLPLKEYKKLIKGKEFTFPKKYKLLRVTYVLTKGGRNVEYVIDFKR